MVTEAVVGLVAAGGLATRLAPLPCSKELYPIGFHSQSIENSMRPKVVSHYLLEKMRLAGIVSTYIVLRPGKWDIPAYFGDGSMLDMHLAYLIVGAPYGAPYSLDQAYPFVRDGTVAFGFPDIIFQSDDAFSVLLAHQRLTGADLVLGLCPADHPEQVDMVDLDQNRVVKMVFRPRQTQLYYSWCVAVWAQSFTQFLHNFLSAHKDQVAIQPELSIGEVIQAAIQQKLTVNGVVISSEPYVDIGTPEGLLRTVKNLAAQLA